MVKNLRCSKNWLTKMHYPHNYTYLQMPQIGRYFIVLKSYMHIGMSTKRLKENNMLDMDEIQKFSSELCEKIPKFSIMDESEISRIVVLQNQNRYIERWINGIGRASN